MATTTLPAADYISNSARTEGEAKQALEDIIQVARELPGASAETELTISAGAITPTIGTLSVDTESDAASDDLANISAANMSEGRVIIIRNVDASRVVIVKNGAGGSGQIYTTNGSDLRLANPLKCVALQLRGTAWYEVFRSTIDDYIYLAYSVASGTQGGDATAGWNTRPLNTEVDAGNNCTLSSNQFTLLPGSYEIKANGVTGGVGYNRMRLRNITASSTTLLGINSHSNSTYDINDSSSLSGRFTITASTTYELQHYCQSANAGDGLGADSGTGENEVYTIIELKKVA